MEAENNRKLPYLDIQIIRRENNIRTTVYRKPTANKEIVHFTSKTPLPYKISIIKAYFYRALTFCSDRVLLEEEV